jgi:tRNA pseudouridine-54 N-methylase
MSKALTKALLKEVESKLASVRSGVSSNKKGGAKNSKALKKKKAKKHPEQLPGYLVEQARKKNVMQRLKRERNVSNHRDMNTVHIILPPRPTISAL